MSGVALVTGGNHGIGRATAAALGRDGFDVAVTYLRFTPDDDDGRPDQYRVDREREADIGALRIEADLSDPTAPTRVFDQVERELGPVSVLVNYASGWRKDTFTDEPDHLGRCSDLVTAESVDVQFHVDARSGALLIAELGRLR